MECRLWWFCFRLLLLAFVPLSCCGVMVRFLNPNPIYVMTGQNLVLKAEIKIPSAGYITRVTWDVQRQEDKEPKVLAEYPSEASDSQVSVEENGSVLKLQNYQKGDAGVYTVIVRDQSGGNSSAQCKVHDYVGVHHVSVMVNISHSSLHCMEAWGTEPIYSWLHEHAAVTEDVGQVSADGMSLYLRAPPCGHFTCIISNKLGHSSDTYSAEPCPVESNGTAVVIVCLLLLLIIAAGLAFQLWRKRQSYRHRRERLQESYEVAALLFFMKLFFYLQMIYRENQSSQHFHREEPLSDTLMEHYHRRTKDIC